MSDAQAGRRELVRFREEVGAVAVKRDLWTATEFGARLNRLMSATDRRKDSLSLTQQGLLELARSHVQAMMNCPRRMRLDDTWQDDFVLEARKAADILISLYSS